MDRGLPSWGTSTRTRVAATVGVLLSTTVLIVAATRGAWIIAGAGWVATSLSLAAAWTTRVAGNDGAPRKGSEGDRVPADAESSFPRRRAALRTAISLGGMLGLGVTFSAFGDPTDIQTIIPFLLTLAVLAAQSGAASGALAAIVAAVVYVWMAAPSSDTASLVTSTIGVGVAALTIDVVVASLVRRATRAERATQIANDRLRRTALRDSMTGLLDARGFDHAMRLELSRQQRQSEDLALVLFDFDRLRTVNEGFGRPAGDMAISVFAEAIERHTRETDIAARIDNDEFALLLPGTDAAGADFVADRILKRFAREFASLVPQAVAPITAASVMCTPDVGDPEAFVAAAQERITAQRAARDPVAPDQNEGERHVR